MQNGLATSWKPILVAVAGIALAGCAESSFILASDSRLPAWFEVPSGHSREELSVTMDYYISASGRTARFKMFDSRGRQLNSTNGTLAGLEPRKLSSTSRDTHYPLYEIITANGVTDVIEHRAMEPVFYVTENPVIRRELGVEKWRACRLTTRLSGP